MLTKIKISGYKSLANLEIGLQPLSLLFGPNSAGKSNFLDALQLLSRIATSRTLKDAFEPPYRGKPLESFTFEAKGLQGLLAKESISFAIEADIKLSPQAVAMANRQILEMKQGQTAKDSSKKAKDASFVREEYLRYRVQIEILPKSGILRVADEYLAALNVKGDIKRQRKPFLEKMGNRLHLRMEGQSHPVYHDCYLDHSILSMPLYPPHYPHLTALRQELASWFFFYFEPRERMRAPSSVKEVRHIGLMGEELAAFLNTLHTLDDPQFKAVEKSLHLMIPNITGIDVGVNTLGEVELKLLEDSIPIPARIVSEGTLRILGMLAIGGVKDPPALIGFEEPENGVHPRRIQMIAAMLKNRIATGNTQLIATTHSPLLPNMIGNDNLFVCRKQDRYTVIESFQPTLSKLSRPGDIDQALNQEELSVSERILRGDFDA